MHQKSDMMAFEAEMLPHLNAAYGLARWLIRSNVDAEDIVQEAYLKAWKSFGDYRGKNGKAWMLMIVRNTCFTWLKTHRAEQLQTFFDEEIHTREEQMENPETEYTQNRDRQLIRQAVDSLPVEFREVLVLREWEGFSYKEISEIVDIPIGTVMSRLVRARERLQKSLTESAHGR